MACRSVGAAPHCPAGHFSPYSDGEKDAVTNDFANYHHRIEAVKLVESEMTADVVGPVCESGDFLALDRRMDFFQLADETVWGATARMLHELLTVAYDPPATRTAAK